MNLMIDGGTVLFWGGASTYENVPTPVELENFRALLRECESSRCQFTVEEVQDIGAERCFAYTKRGWDLNHDKKKKNLVAVNGIQFEETVYDVSGDLWIRSKTLKGSREKEK